MLQVFPSERSMNIQADDASTVKGDVARGSSKSRAMLKRQSKGKKQGTFNTAQNNTALPSILFSSKIFRSKYYRLDGVEIRR